MKKTLKAFFIMFMIALACFNIYMILYAFIFYSFGLTFLFSLAFSIAFLFISFLAWLFSNSDNKISINYRYLYYGLSAFLVLLIHSLCYWLTLTKFSGILFIILALAFIICILIAFSENFTVRNFVISTLISVFIAHILFPFFLILCVMLLAPPITNPLAYKYVILHELTPSEASSLPSKIPSDATNVNFCFSETDRDGHSYSLELEFYSNTIESNDHHAKYHIKSNDDD